MIFNQDPSTQIIPYHSTQLSFGRHLSRCSKCVPGFSCWLSASCSTRSLLSSQHTDSSIFLIFDTLFFVDFLKIWVLYATSAFMDILLKTFWNHSACFLVKFNTNFIFFGKIQQQVNNGVTLTQTSHSKGSRFGWLSWWLLKGLLRNL